MFDALARRQLCSVCNARPHRLQIRSNGGGEIKKNENNLGADKLGSTRRAVYLLLHHKNQNHIPR